MSISEILEQAQFLVDADGNRKAVVMDYQLWEGLVSMLEDLEDAREIEQLRSSPEERLPWEEARVMLRKEGRDV